MSLRQVSLAQSQVHKLIGSTVSVQFQISTDPTKTASKVFGGILAPASYSFLATALRVDDGQEFRLRVPIRVICSNPQVLDLLPGQLVHATGRLRQSKEARVAALFLAQEEIVVDTPASRWASSLGAIRTHLRALVGRDDAGALIPGMVLGDTSLQSDQFKNAMRRSGLTHLVAVSGANFAIISLFVLWCMQWLFKSLQIRLIFTAIALASFIALVRPSPSVLRAAAMASVVLVARGVGKRSDPLAALGFAIAAVVIGDPWQARDPGFALSVMATAGLLLLSPRIAHRLRPYLPKFICESLAPPISAVVMCAPILVALSGYLGPMTVIANLLSTAMVAPITILGFLAALIAPLSPWTASILLALIHWPAWWIAGVAHWAANFPVIQLTTGLGGFIAGSVFIFLLFLFLILIKKARAVVIFVSVVALLSFAWAGQWPIKDWQVANCDVGQGDSLVINLGDHRGLVIDTGPDPALEDRCLARLGINEIPLLVLTHFHADHVEGLSGAMHRRHIGAVWVSSNNDPIFESSRVFSLLGKIDHQVVTRGTTATLVGSNGALTIVVFWPDDRSHSFDLIPEEGSAINNSSVALLISTPDFTLFAGGDVEPSAQAEIAGRVGQVDIYKVSHHGSLYQDRAFMAELAPTISLISVGAHNSYAHPAEQTLEALARLPSRIYRTDTMGAISIGAKGHRLVVRTSAGAWWQKVRLG